jgi:hypothetical protein
MLKFLGGDRAKKQIVPILLKEAATVLGVGDGKNCQSAIARGSARLRYWRGSRP